MKVARTYAADEERTLITAMILHSPVLERIAGRLGKKEKCFRSRWANTVSQWCLEYFRRYGKAPRKSIHHLFEKYAATGADKESIELIANFLDGLSQDVISQAKDMNEQFIVDMASDYFGKVRLERLQQDLEAALERSDRAAAEEALKTYEPIAFGAGDWTDPTDTQSISEALSMEEHQSVIQFRGALGEFLSPYFERDAFISFVGPEKSGKSFWLMEVAWQAMLQHRRVLYYVIGDMSQHQVMRRLLCRALRRPLRPKTLEIPYQMIREGKNVRLRSKTKEFKNPITVKRAVEGMQEILQKTGAVESRLRLKCCGAGEISASQIEQDVRDEVRKGWVPDAVVLDYADLLAPELIAKGWDFRHQQNESWKVMRRISQNNHLLFVTGTQAAATSYGATLIRKSDFSEDKRKNAHVTGMLGINQMSEEKKQCIYRLNWVFLRDGGWTDSEVVHTAGNWLLACPCIVSTL